MICPACEKDVNPIDDLGTDMRLTRRCPIPSCMAAFPRESQPSQAKPQAAAPSVASRQLVPVASSLDVLGLAKARLTALEAELTALEAKRAEAAMLRRMILAAEMVDMNERDHLDA